MQERKCFVCRGCGHIACYCRNMEEEGSILMPSNRFKVLKNRIINIKEGNGMEISKNRKTILRKERLKREKSVEV